MVLSAEPMNVKRSGIVMVVALCLYISAYGAWHSYNLASINCIQKELSRTIFFKIRCAILPYRCPTYSKPCRVQAFLGIIPRPILAARLTAACLPGCSTQLLAVGVTIPSKVASALGPMGNLPFRVYFVNTFLAWLSETVSVLSPKEGDIRKVPVALFANHQFIVSNRYMAVKEIT